MQRLIRLACGNLQVPHLALNFFPDSGRRLVTDSACASSKVRVCLRLFGPGWEDSPLQALDETRSVFSVEQHAALSIDLRIELSG